MQAMQAVSGWHVDHQTPASTVVGSTSVYKVFDAPSCQEVEPRIGVVAG